MTVNCARGRLTRFVVAILLTMATAASAAEVKVLAANAVKRSVSDIVAAFERASGHQVTVTWGGTDAIAKRVGAGEIVDVVIIAAPNIDKLAQAGKLVAGSRTDFARSGVGVAVRSGLAHPDISTAAALKQAVLGAKSIAYSTGPSGAYIAELLARLGVSDAVKDKVKQPASGVQIGEFVARGEADLGFQQISELIDIADLDYLGSLPDELQNVTVYAAGLHAAAAAPQAAQAFVKMLVAPESAATIKRSGMEPASP